MTPCICWLGTSHPCNPPHYGLWVNLRFFTSCIYKHCFLPMLLVFAIKYYIKMPCSLPHNHYCCSLPSPVCLPHLLICTCLISSPIACPPSSVLCWCLYCAFSFFLFLWYVAFLRDLILACCFCVVFFIVFLCSCVLLIVLNLLFLCLSIYTTQGGYSNSTITNRKWIVNSHSAVHSKC